MDNSVLQVEQPDFSQSTPPKDISRNIRGAPRIAIVITTVTLVLLIGISGYYLATKKNQSISQKTYPKPTSYLTPSATITPPPTSLLLISTPSAGFITITSSKNGYSLSFPSSWTISEKPVDSNDIYIRAPIGPGFNEGGPYVWINKAENKNNLDFVAFITKTYGFSTKWGKVVDDEIGQYNVKVVTGIPGNSEGYSVFFPTEGNGYINVSLWKYSNNEFNTFKKILASFKLVK